MRPNHRIRPLDIFHTVENIFPRCGKIAGDFFGFQFPILPS